MNHIFENQPSGLRACAHLIIFLSWTALFAAGLTLLAQALVIPWLYFVSSKLLGMKTPGTIEIKETL